MTAEVACSACQTARPAADTYERVPGSGERFCRDTAGCRLRLAGVGDPVADVFAVTRPPAVPAAAGGTCDVCGAAADVPGGLYARTATLLRCRDRAGCQERQLTPDMAPATEDFAEVGRPQLAAMLHAAAASGAHATGEPAPLDPVFGYRP